MARLALVGDPIEHSLSPAIHGAALAAAGLDWEYRLHPVARGELASAWPELGRRYRGISVTAPHKREAARLVDRLTAAAADCASVNTVCFEPGGAVGDSTDGQGFISALRREVMVPLRRAVVLGTGGAARSVVAALAEAGAEVRVLGRNRAAGTELVGELRRVRPGTVGFGGDGDRALIEALAGAQLLVNATTVGAPHLPDACPVPAAVELPADLVVFDLVYWPRETPLQQRARSAGCQVIDGLEMLLEQAALAFRAFTGAPPLPGVMREAAQREMARAGSR